MIFVVSLVQFRFVFVDLSINAVMVPEEPNGMAQMKLRKKVFLKAG
jgi:hypothetical protein